jgi:hypothetical protein
MAIYLSNWDGKLSKTNNGLLTTFEEIFNCIDFSSSSLWDSPNSILKPQSYSNMIWINIGLIFSINFFAQLLWISMNTFVVVVVVVEIGCFDLWSGRHGYNPS